MSKPELVTVPACVLFIIVLTIKNMPEHRTGGIRACGLRELSQ